MIGAPTLIAAAMTTRLLVLILALATTALAACGGAPLPRPAPVRVQDPVALVERYYARVNAEDLAGVMALFDPRVEMVEPFSQPERATSHRGAEAVGRFLQAAFRARDDQVVPEYVRPAAAHVEAGWSLQSADGTALSGVSRFDVRAGQITRIVIELRE